MLDQQQDSQGKKEKAFDKIKRKLYASRKLKLSFSFWLLQTILSYFNIGLMWYMCIKDILVDKVINNSLKINEYHQDRWKYILVILVIFILWERIESFFYIIKRVKAVKANAFIQDYNKNKTNPSMTGKSFQNMQAGQQQCDLKQNQINENNSHILYNNQNNSLNNKQFGTQQQINININNNNNNAQNRNNINSNKTINQNISINNQNNGAQQQAYDGKKMASNNTSELQSQNNEQDKKRTPSTYSNSEIGSFDGNFQQNLIKQKTQSSVNSLKVLSEARKFNRVKQKLKDQNNQNNSNSNNTNNNNTNNNINLNIQNLTQNNSTTQNNQNTVNLFEDFNEWDYIQKQLNEIENMEQQSVEVYWYILTVLLLIFFLDYTLYYVRDKKLYLFKKYCRKQMAEVFFMYTPFAMVSGLLILQYLIQNESCPFYVYLTFFLSLYLMVLKLVNGYTQRIQQLSEVEIKIRNRNFEYFKSKTQLYLTNPFQFGYFKQLSKEVYFHRFLLRIQRENNTDEMKGFQNIHVIQIFFQIYLQSFVYISLIVLSDITSLSFLTYKILIIGILVYLPQTVWYLQCVFRASRSTLSVFKKIQKFFLTILGSPFLSIMGCFAILLPCNTENIPLVKPVKETWPNNVMSSKYAIIIRLGVSLFHMYQISQVLNEELRGFPNNAYPQELLIKISRKGSGVEAAFNIVFILWVINVVFLIAQGVMELVYSGENVGTGVDSVKLSQTVSQKINKKKQSLENEIIQDQFNELVSNNNKKSMEILSDIDQQSEKKEESQEIDYGRKNQLKVNNNQKMGNGYKQSKFQSYKNDHLTPNDYQIYEKETDRPLFTNRNGQSSQNNSDEGNSHTIDNINNGQQMLIKQSALTDEDLPKEQKRTNKIQNSQIDIDNAIKNQNKYVNIKHQGVGQKKIQNKFMAQSSGSSNTQSQALFSQNIQESENFNANMNENDKLKKNKKRGSSNHGILQNSLRIQQSQVIKNRDQDSDNDKKNYKNKGFQHNNLYNSVLNSQGLEFSENFKSIFEYDSKNKKQSLPQNFVPRTQMFLKNLEQETNQQIDQSYAGYIFDDNFNVKQNQQFQEEKNKNRKNSQGNQINQNQNQAQTSNLNQLNDSNNLENNNNTNQLKINNLNMYSPEESQDDLQEVSDEQNTD